MIKQQMASLHPRAGEAIQQKASRNSWHRGGSPVALGTAGLD
jgi:hypothetical protein